MSEVSPKLIHRLREKLDEGRRLLQKGVLFDDWNRWWAETDFIVERIDPYGNSLTTGTLNYWWTKARWFRGYDAKNDLEAEIVLRNQVSTLADCLDEGFTVARSHRQNSVTVSGPYNQRRVDPSPNLVFVLMPFTEEWSDRIWKKHIRPAVTAVDSEPSLICLRADDLTGQDVMIDIYENIAKARVVIADITNRNANVFYELGIAHTLGKHVILVTQRTSDIPFDLQRFRHIVYQDNSEGCEKLEAGIRMFLQQALSSTTQE